MIGNTGNEKPDRPTHADQPARAEIEEAIRWSVIDLLLLRKELNKHDFGLEEKEKIVQAATPAFAILESLLRVDVEG